MVKTICVLLLVMALTAGAFALHPVFGVLVGMLGLGAAEGLLAK